MYLTDFQNTQRKNRIAMRNTFPQLQLKTDTILTIDKHRKSVIVWNTSKTLSTN